MYFGHIYFPCNGHLYKHLVNCGVPDPPVNGTVDTPDHTREGSSVDYRCDDGFRPSANFTSICDNTTLWIPPPQSHICTFIVGMTKH